jgi:hypothetical protein
MKTRSIGIATLALLGTLALVAPAHATLTPVGGAIAGTAFRPTFTSMPGAAIRITCPKSTFRGTISPDGRSISGSFDFPRTTVDCTTTATGGVCLVTTRGTVTFTSTGSTAGNNANFSFSLDNGFELSINCNLLTVRFSGPAAVSCAQAAYFQASGTLIVRCTLRSAARTDWELAAQWSIGSRPTVS